MNTGLEPSNEENKEKLKSRKKKNVNEYQPDISNLQDFKRIHHVQYDIREARYKDLPSEVEKSNPNFQFGISYRDLPKIKYGGYKMLIPGVLIMLLDSLKRIDGFKSLEIFRREGEHAVIQDTINSINIGGYKECDDPYVLSTILKIFYTELPEGIINGIEYEDETKDTFALIKKLDDHKRSLLLFILDICREVIKLKEFNKMSEQFLSICLTPCLYHPEGDPVKWAQHIKDYVFFMYNRILLSTERI